MDDEDDAELDALVGKIWESCARTSRIIHGWGDPELSELYERTLFRDVTDES